MGGIRIENFQGFTKLQILAEIQNMMTEIQCEPEQFPGRISSCQCITTLCGEKKRKRRSVSRLPKSQQNMLEDSRMDIGRFLGLDQRKENHTCMTCG